MIRKRVRADSTIVYDARHGSGPQRTFDKHSDAQEYVDDERRKARRSRAGLEEEQGPITLAELFTLWEANFSPSPWRKSMFKRTLERWGDVQVRQIKPEAFGAWLHGLPVSGKTKKHILESARQVFRAGVEWGYLRLSPVRPGAFKPPSEKRVRPIRPFASWAEVEAVAEQLDYRQAAFVLFCCATGVRAPGEAMAVRWEDINRREWTVFVRGTKTENAPRTIPLSELAWDAIVMFERPIDRSEPVFNFDYHEFRKTLWPAALAAAGLEKRTPYEMRHTFATLSLEAGANLEDVSKVLGHADIGITLRYYRKWTRPMLDRLRSVLNTIGKETHSEADSGS